MELVLMAGKYLFVALIYLFVYMVYRGLLRQSAAAPSAPAGREPRPQVLHRPARRAGVLRRALRMEVTRIRHPRRILAITILVLVFGLALAGDSARANLQ